MDEDERSLHPDLHTLWHLESTSDLSEGRFHILISQAVYHRAQHGDDHTVEDRHYLVFLEGFTWTAPQIHADEGPKENGHSSEVGGACGESLNPATWRVHPQNGLDAKQVGNQDDQGIGQNHKVAKEDNDSLSVCCVTAGKLQKKKLIWLLSQKERVKAHMVRRMDLATP